MAAMGDRAAPRGGGRRADEPTLTASETIVSDEAEEIPIVRFGRMRRGNRPRKVERRTRRSGIDREDGGSRWSIERLLDESSADGRVA